MKGVSLEVRQGEIVCLIGANGAGKTTLLNCLSGIHPARNGKVFFMGEDVSHAPSQKMVRLGIVQVPENRQLFGPLTVEENLEMGAYSRAGKLTRNASSQKWKEVFQLFPPLKARRKQRAGTLSGGNNKWLPSARGLMSDPRLLLSGRALARAGALDCSRDIPHHSGTPARRSNHTTGGAECLGRADYFSTGLCTLRADQ